MPDDLKPILDELPRYRETAERLRDLVLGNLVMVGEIPASTFGEAQRVEFLCERFAESGCANASVDQAGNGLAVLPGTEGGRAIALVAHVDTVFPEGTDFHVSVSPDRVIGPGISDDSLGLAALLTLPALLADLRISLRSDVVLLGATRSMGRGDLEGIRFFLDNGTVKPRAGICVEGAQLGRLSTASTGMIRGEITAKVPREYDWTKFGITSAILVMSDVISAIGAIPTPQRPRTRIVLGSVHGGNAYHTIATHAVLRFEVRSESADMVEEIRRRLEDIVHSVSARSRADVTLDILARRQPGGIEVGHPLVRCAGAVLTALGVEPVAFPSAAELSAFVARGIPAATIGISKAENQAEPDEAVLIEPIATGLAQLIGILLAVDRACPDAN